MGSKVRVWGILPNPCIPHILTGSGSVRTHWARLSLPCVYVTLSRISYMVSLSAHLFHTWLRLCMKFSVLMMQECSILTASISIAESRFRGFSGGVLVFLLIRDLDLGAFSLIYWGDNMRRGITWLWFCSSMNYIFTSISGRSTASFLSMSFNKKYFTRIISK